MDGSGKTDGLFGRLCVDGQMDGQTERQTAFAATIIFPYSVPREV